MWVGGLASSVGLGDDKRRSRDAARLLHSGRAAVPGAGALVGHTAADIDGYAAVSR